MTVVTTTSPPIAETFARAADRIAYFGATYGEMPEGWMRCSDVINNPDAVSQVLDRVLGLYGTDNRQIGAAFLVLGYFWSPMLAAVASLAVDRRLPDLAPDQVAFDLRSVRFLSPRCFVLPDDASAGSPDTEVLPDMDAMRDQLVRQLEAHAQPFFTNLRAVAPYGVNGMRANYVDRLVSAIVWVADALNDPDFARRETPAVVNRLFPGSRAGVIEVEHEGQCRIFQQRHGCCLNYRLPGKPKCETCSIRPYEERITLFREIMANPDA